jgi:HEAT repeat protein
VRAAAAEAIGKLRTPKSQELLQQALQDDDGGVRKVAEEALAALHQAGFEEGYDPFAED